MAYYFGSNGPDHLGGSYYADAIYGYGGDDVIYGFKGNDHLYGGNDHDKLFGNDGDDELYGDSGNDALLGGAGFDVLRGGSGDDKYWVNLESNYGYSQRPDHVLEFENGGTDEIITRMSFFDMDQMYFSGYRFYGGRNVENLTAASNATVRFNGNGLHNVITTLNGADLIDGRGGDDSINSGRGKDTLFGGDGNDRLAGGEDQDRMYGGQGNDFYSVLSSNDRVIEYLSKGFDTVFAAANYRLPAHVEKLIAGDSAFRAIGNELDNLIIGSDVGKFLYGLAGSDNIRAGGGSDRLFGGTGRDVLSGGAGADLFMFDDGGTAAIRGIADKITDFDAGEGDRINLRFIDANEHASGDQNFEFIGTDAFTGRVGELGYRIVNGVTFVEGDTDGDRYADFAIRVQGDVEFLATDLIL